MTLRDAKIVGKALSRIARARGHVAAFGDEKTMSKPDWLLPELRSAVEELQSLLDAPAAAK